MNQNSKTIIRLLFLFHFFFVSCCFSCDMKGEISFETSSASTQIHSLFDPIIYLGKFLREDSKHYVKEGIIKKINGHLDEALENFFQGSRRGDLSSMDFMGQIYEQQSIDLRDSGKIKEYIVKKELALKWYTLSFQYRWLNDSTKAYNYSAKKKLENLLARDVNIFLIYPEEAIDPVDKAFRLHAIIEFYKNKSAEPYLTDEENNLKIQIFQEKLNLLFFRINSDIRSMMTFQMKENSSNLGVDFQEKGLFRKAKSYFMKSLIPNALHSIGYMYAQGEGQYNNIPDYENAALYYKKAATSNSFGNLGKLYHDGYIGQINGIPDYATAKLYCELSGNSEALIGLGILYRDGLIERKPNYKLAKRHFKKSKSAHGYILLVYLYMDIKTSENINYEKIKKYLELAINIDEENPLFNKKDYLEAHGLLGYLYGAGKVPAKNSNLLAIKYFTQATHCENEAVRTQAYYNLGVLYSDNLYNYSEAVKNYKKASTSNSFNNIGYLYEKGYYGLKKNGKPNYEKAIKYYKKSDYYLSKLSILMIYLHDYKGINNNIINAINEINKLIPTLEIQEQFYLKGLTEYYLGNLLEAVEDLKLASLFGNNQEKSESLIQDIENDLSQSQDHCDEDDEVYEDITFESHDKNLQEDQETQSIKSNKVQKTKKLKIEKISCNTKRFIKKNKEMSKARHATQKFMENNTVNKIKNDSFTVNNIFYQTSLGKNYFKEWINTLPNSSQKEMIEENLEKLKLNRGSIKKIKSCKNILELRIKKGGYRIYFSKIFLTENLILLGGDKTTQIRDIKKASELLAYYTNELH